MVQVTRVREKLTTLAAIGVGVASIAAVTLVTLACSKDSAASTHGLGASPNGSAPLAAGPHADGDHFSIDGALVSPCAPNSECSVALKLTVRDDYHVNMEFPHKFTAVDAPGVEFLGKDAAKKNVFSKVSGDFVSTDPKSGVLTVRFKSQPGSPTIQGIMKIGVCSEQNCLLPQVEIAVPVTVK
jgi:hypothetical protein